MRRTPDAAFLVAIGAWGYASGIHGSVAPFLAEGFGLSDAAMARWWTAVGLSSLLALALGRQADRLGRRRVLLASVVVLGVACLLVAAAPGPLVYVAGQMLAFAAGGTVLGTTTVAIAEELPDAARARGQGRAGFVLAAASALPLAGVALLAGAAEPWRAVWAAGGLVLLAIPWLRRALPETARWKAARERGATGAARLGDVFRPQHRRRALAVLVAVLAVQAAELAARAWLFYHPVRSLGVDPRTATALLVGCGGLGLFGFRLGGTLADRRGRRCTFAWAGVLFALSTAVYYAATPHLRPGALRLGLLGVSLVGLSATGNAALVAFRSLAVELFPTALRGTVGGWMAVGAAGGWLMGMGAVALLAEPLGGVGPAVALLGVVALPTAVLALSRVPETAGRPLDTLAPDVDARGAALTGI